MEPNAQEVLWRIPNAMGHGWWIMCSGIATAATLTSFLYLIMNEKSSPLLLSRVIICAGMLCFSLLPLNSGWLPWGVLLTSIGYLYAAFLIATDWCHTHDKWARLRELACALKPGRNSR